MTLLPYQLQALPTSVVERLRAAARTALYRRDETLVAAWVPPEETVFINFGWVCQVYGDAYGTLIGYRGFVQVDSSFPLTIGRLVAVSDEVSATHIRSEVLREVLIAHPRELWLLSSQLGRQRVEADRVFATRTWSTEIRLAHLLWRIAEPDPDDAGLRVFPGTFSQLSMARVLGVPREEISRARALLLRTGYIFVDKQRRDCMDPSLPLLLTAGKLTV